METHFAASLTCTCSCFWSAMYSKDSGVTSSCSLSGVTLVKNLPAESSYTIFTEILVTHATVLEFRAEQYTTWPTNWGHLHKMPKGKVIMFTRFTWKVHWTISCYSYFSNRTSSNGGNDNKQECEDHGRFFCNEEDTNLWYHNSWYKKKVHCTRNMYFKVWFVLVNLVKFSLFK